MVQPTIVNKNFRVKNGLNVAGNTFLDGNATVGADLSVSNTIVLNSAPIAFNAETNRLQIYINGTWLPIAFQDDIIDTTSSISFMDIGLAIDYNGQPIYTVYANGVVTTGTKFADGGKANTNAFGMTFDSGTI
jgi:hypothetical protein